MNDRSQSQHKTNWEVVKEFRGENNTTVVVKRAIVKGRYARYSLTIGTLHQKEESEFVSPYVPVKVDGLVNIEVERVGMTIVNLVALAEEWIKEDAEAWAKKVQDDLFARDSLRSARDNRNRRTRHTGKTQRNREKKLQRTKKAS